jgi:bifunctional oligoribonuclease and PAP phosphatase NrnA
MSELNIQINAAALALSRAKTVVTVSHRRPDGDTIGSSLALAAALEAVGKTVHCFCVDAPPDSLSFLANVGRFTSDSSVFNGADAVVVLDSGDLRFVAIEPILAGLPKRPLLLDIDHHVINDNFGDVNAVVTTAASTTEVVFMILKAMKLPITPSIATCLLVGIVTDTMMFFNPATTASSLQVAAELERLGGDMKAVSRLISKNRNVGSLVLWGKALERLKWDETKSHASTAVMEHEIACLPPGDDAIDGLSNFLNNNLSAKTVMVLRELGGGLVKGSLRTACDDINVCDIAVKYGGGGHRKAAGFVVKGKIVENPNEWTVQAE